MGYSFLLKSWIVGVLIALIIAPPISWLEFIARTIAQIVILIIFNILFKLVDN